MAPTVREGKNAPVNSGNGAGKAPAQDAALLEELRRFVRDAAHQPAQPEGAPPGSEPVGRLQAVVLVVLVLDVVLLYSEFQEWLENPLFLLALKVLPWLLGATAIAYSDKAREWILAQCRHKWLAVFAVLIALPLLIVRQRMFSVIVGVDSDSVLVEAADPGDKVGVTPQTRGLFRVTVPNLLKPYRITIHPRDEDLYSSPFSLDLGRWRVVRGTLAQIPLIGKLLGTAHLQLAPLHRLVTDTPEGGGAADIEGTFEEGFLQSASLTELHCNRASPTKTGDSAIHCMLKTGGGALRLPPGTYKLKLSRVGCDKLFTDDNFVVSRTQYDPAVSKTDDKTTDPKAVWDPQRNEFHLDKLCAD
jgi:hypothetical protein